MAYLQCPLIMLAGWNSSIHRSSFVIMPSNEMPLTNDMLCLQKRTGHTSLDTSNSKKRRFVTPFKENSDPNQGANNTPVISLRKTFSHSPGLRRGVLKNSKFKPPSVSDNNGIPAPQVICNASETRLQEAKEELRRLQIVDYHRTHNDLNTLSMLTKMWKDVGHDAVHVLHQSISMDPKPSPTELLMHLRIPPTHINCECEEGF